MTKISLLVEVSLTLLVFWLACAYVSQPPRMLDTFDDQPHVVHPLVSTSHHSFVPLSAERKPSCLI